MHVCPNYYKIFFTFLQSIGMSGNSINFNDKKIEKSNFYKNKEIFDMSDIDVNEIFVSKKEKYGKTLYWV